MTVHDLLEMVIESGTVIEIYFDNSHVYYHGCIDDLHDTLSFIFYHDFLISCKDSVLLITILTDNISEKHQS